MHSRGKHQGLKHHCSLLNYLLQVTIRFLWQSICICLKGFNSFDDALEQDHKHEIHPESRNSSELQFGKQISNCQVLTDSEEALASSLRR